MDEIMVMGAEVLIEHARAGTGFFDPESVARYADRDVRSRDCWTMVGNVLRGHRGADWLYDKAKEMLLELAADRDGETAP